MSNNFEKRVVYFCMEYGLDTRLPLYAGGLGILAGDYLKTAHDLGAPIIGIGLLWWQDYTKQLIGEYGYPYDTYPIYDFSFLEDTGKKFMSRLVMKMWNAVSIKPTNSRTMTSIYWIPVSPIANSAGFQINFMQEITITGSPRRWSWVLAESGL